jgi:hypothetical protein
MPRVKSIMKIQTIQLAAVFISTACWASAARAAGPAGPTTAQFKQTPPYSPEFSTDDPRIVKHLHQVLNVMDFGAKGDGQSHPLHTLFANQAAIDVKYGPGRYTPDDEADFVAVMEALRTARACGEYIPSIKAVKYTNTVYLPTGIYVINRTIPLIDTFGGTIRGDGRQQTVLRFNAPQPLFFINRSAFLAFRQFSIESSVSSGSTGFLIADTSDTPLGNGKPTFKMIFDSLIFQRLDQAVHITGLMMTDSMVFSDTRFLQCLTSFHLQNPQGLNYQFFGCDFEDHGGDAIYAPHKASDVVCFKIEAGGNITIVGGDIIHAGVTLLLEPGSQFAPEGPGGASPSISVGSGMYSFYGVKWEQMGGTRSVLFDAQDDGHYSARINFDNCMVYQRISARHTPVGMLHAGMNVAFRNSVFNFGHIQEVLDPGQAKRKATLILDNTSGLTYQRAKGDYHHVIKDRDATP